MNYKQLFLSLLLFVFLALASSAQDNIDSESAANTLKVFVRTGCPHCADAKEYLPKFIEKHPEIRLQYLQVDTDPTARDQLIFYSKQSGHWPPGVPTFIYDDRVYVGFPTPIQMEQELLQLIYLDGKMRDAIKSDWFGNLSASELGLPLFSLAIGLLDGFNPCAMWVLLFLLSLLVHLKSRKRMAIIAGTFVLVSGLVYYAFMAAWLNVFLAVGMTKWVQVTLAFLAIFIGIVNMKEFILPKKGISLSIPDSAKPGIYARMRSIVQAENLTLALIAATSLAIAVNFIELLCTAGFPAMYTAILAQQELSSVSYYGYIGLYIIGYIADDSLMVTIAVIALSNQKLTQKSGQYLKLLSGAVMLLLGFVMLLKPEWLL